MKLAAGRHARNFRSPKSASTTARIAVTSLTPDVLVTYVQNKNLSEAARKQLGEILNRKRQIADNEAERHRVEAQVNNIVRDQDRLRQNINSLNHVSRPGGAGAEIRAPACRSGRPARYVARPPVGSGTQERRTTIGLNSLIEKMEF